MITALDHIVLVCPDIEAGVDTYQTLLGSSPTWRTEAEGQASALFQTANTALELIAPLGAGEISEKLRAMSADGARLTSMAYRSEILDADHHTLTRRGFEPSEITPKQSTDKQTGETRSWRSFRVPDQKMAGIKTFLLQSDKQDTENTQPIGRGAVASLDHLVINTPNPDRTLANYGARLGLRLALDRTAPQWKTRFLFFRIGNLTLEIIHRLDTEHQQDAPDQIWGITWQTNDLEAAHARLSAAGVTVSELRVGRKPGSRVFTVKSGTLGIPTLFITHAEGKQDS